MGDCGGLPRKYIYVRAHSNVPDGLEPIASVENVSYINTIDTDGLCWHDTTGKNRTLEIFASYNTEEREYNLQSFMRNLRFYSTTPELRDTTFYPSRSIDATNQPFAFYHESETVTLPLGIWDLDELRDRVTNLNRSTILDRPTTVFFQELGFSADTSTHILTLEEIRDILMERYPGRCIVIIMGGCRLIQTPERVVLQSREERNPDEVPEDALAEAFGQQRIHQSSEEADPARMQVDYRGRNFNEDYSSGYDPLSNPMFPITSQPGRKREVSPPPSSPKPKKRGGRKTLKNKRSKSKRSKSKRSKNKRGTRKGRKGKK